MAPIDIVSADGDFALRIETRSILIAAIAGVIFATTLLIGGLICGCCRNEDDSKAVTPKKNVEQEKRTLRRIMTASRRDGQHTMRSTNTISPCTTEYTTHMTMPSCYNPTKIDESPSSIRIPLTRSGRAKLKKELRSAPDLQLSSFRTDAMVSYRLGEKKNVEHKTTSPSKKADQQEPSFRMMTVIRKESSSGRSPTSTRQKSPDDNSVVRRLNK